MNNAPAPKRILIADDEPLYLRTTGELLRRAGYECECVADAESALQRLRHQHFDLILSDLNMPGNLKLQLLREGRSRWPHIPLIVITGVPSLPTAIEGVRLGIADYLLKPVKFDDLLAGVRRVLDKPAEARMAIAAKTDESARTAKDVSILGRSEPMLEILEIVEKVAATDTNVLITGESGTGKEVVARVIHDKSPRRARGFQIIDCTAIPESLFESVLFGHAKGSFTGAVKDQPGLLAHCDQGTAFFDELGELPLSSQAKLLRVVQEQTFIPVGKNTPVRIDARFICATNRDLEAEVDAGHFRRDLFYRLGVIHIELPPLRQRGDDIALLAQHFLQQLRSINPVVTGLSDEVLSQFRQYAWPGNIRELRNVIERSMVLARSDQIQISDLPRQIREYHRAESKDGPLLTAISREEALDSAERSYLQALVEKHAGNISQAAQQAGLSRQAVHKLLKKHGIAAAEYRA